MLVNEDSVFSFEKIVEEIFLPAEIGDEGFAAGVAVGEMGSEADRRSLVDEFRMVGIAGLGPNSATALEDEIAGSVDHQKPQLEGEPGVRTSEAPMAGDPQLAIRFFHHPRQRPGLDHHRSPGGKVDHPDLPEGVVFGGDLDRRRPALRGPDAVRKTIPEAMLVKGRERFGNHWVRFVPVWLLCCR